MNVFTALAVLALAAAASAAPVHPAIPANFIAESTWSTPQQNTSMRTTAFARGDALYVSMDTPLYYQGCLGELILPNNTAYALECNDKAYFPQHCVTQCVDGVTCRNKQSCVGNVVNYVPIFRNALVNGQSSGACLDGRGDQWSAKYDNGNVEIRYCFSKERQDTPLEISMGKFAEPFVADITIDFHAFVHTDPPVVLFDVPQNCFCPTSLTKSVLASPFSVLANKHH